MKKRNRKINIKLSNKTAYSLMLILAIAIVGVGVYALGAVPNPGHALSDLQVCGANEILQVNSAGNSWSCVNSSWVASGSNIYYNTGNVGIGTSSPSQKLTVNGNIQATAFYYSSDRNLKTNITDLSGSDALKNIMDLQGVSFNWKNNGESSIGFIAQDVQKVYPQLVETGQDGYKSVEYGNLVAVLVEGMKQQQNEINSLKKQIDELKSSS